MNRCDFWTLLSICVALFWDWALTEGEVEWPEKGENDRM